MTSELRTLDIDTSGMVQTIHNLQAAGSRVIYLEDTPNPQKLGPVPDCLARHTGNIQACALDRKQPSTRLEGMIQRSVENRASAAAGATLLDPTDWFCTATTCPPVIDGIVVYADISHTTGTYVQLARSGYERSLEEDHRVTDPHPGSFWTRRRFLLAAAVVTVGAGAGAEVVNLTEGGGGHTLFRPRKLKPAEVLDLRTWKIGLPTTEEVKQPKLEGFSGAAFDVVPAVTFTAHCGDKAQAGSKYARSELREMNADGSNAAWSSTKGTHVMELRQRVTHLPVVKPQVICGQIHNVTDYLILVELDGQQAVRPLQGRRRRGARRRLPARDVFRPAAGGGRRLRRRVSTTACTRSGIR